MRAFGTRSVAAVLALAVLLVGGVACYLALSQASLRHAAEAEFGHRRR